MTGLIVTLGTLAFMATSGMVCGATTPKLTGLLIPYYADVSETSAWNALTTSIKNAGVSSSVPWIIINAEDGPPSSEEAADWKTLASKLRANAKVVVYVDTCTKQHVDVCVANQQGQASVSMITGLLNSWISAIGLSNIDGVFLDDAPVSTTSNNVAAIAAAVRGIIGSSRNIFANPGEDSTPNSQTIKNIDVIIMREDTSVGSSSICSKGDPSQFAMILHDTPLSTSNVNKAKSLCYGWFYATAGSWDSTVASSSADLTKMIKCVASNGC